MKVAIHHTEYSFSERWIAFCDLNKIPYKLVNCYDSDIIDQLRDCDGLMWHWSHTDSKAMQFARQLTYSIEASGKKVFPNSATVWHFDDKVGQKYLLEAIGDSLVPSYVFYDKQSALEWAKRVTYPKVFKLKVGAGSRNVWLVNNFVMAKKLISKSFRNGFLLSDPWIEIKDRYAKFTVTKNYSSFLRLLKGLWRLVFKSQFHKSNLREKGYAYFQDFVPNNEFDLRIVTIGSRAFALKRLVRPGDFRASGSGSIQYPGNEINHAFVKLAFNTSEKIGAQCLAYDFVFDENQNPYIVEISYAFSMLAYDKCLGYWDTGMQWHNKPVNAPLFMIEDFINTIID